MNLNVKTEASPSLLCNSRQVTSSPGLCLSLPKWRVELNDSQIPTSWVFGSVPVKSQEGVWGRGSSILF
jgi:hypothetical protein